MEEFIGFDSIIDGFFNRVDKGTLSHAHLIAGSEGIGKSKIAKIFSLKILGKTHNRSYADIIEFKSSKSSFGVDEVRNIIEEVNKKPYESDRKVIIIYEGSKLTVQAQNALLKTIEEPAKGVYIIILCEALEMMLDTIKSRCQIYKLTPLSKLEIQEYINKNFKVSKEEILAALAYSEGIPGRAERFLNDGKLQELRNLIVSLLKDLGYNNIITEKYEDSLNKFKVYRDEILNLITLFIRDIMIYKDINKKEKIINIDKIEDISELTGLLSYKKLNLIIDCINRARVNLNNNVSFSMTISLMLIGFMED